MPLATISATIDAAPELVWEVIGDSTGPANWPPEAILKTVNTGARS